MYFYLFVFFCYYIGTELNNSHRTNKFCECMKEVKDMVITGLVTSAAVAAKVMAAVKTVSTIGTVMISLQTVVDGVRALTDKG